jgi:AraC-like DNA-binding protein
MSVDVLSDAIRALRTGTPHSRRHELRAPWGMRFAPTATAGFHAVLRGTCWLVPAQGSATCLSAGDVVFVRGRYAHALADSPATPLGGPRLAYRSHGAAAGGGTVVLCGAYQLEHDRPHPLLTGLGDVFHLSARSGRHPALHAAVALLGSELEQPRAGTAVALPALLDMLLLYILRAWFEEQPHHSAIGWAAALADPAIRSALRDIHADPARPWSVAELGTRAGLSRAAFARRFATMVGEPPMTYLTRWRMTTAARLLRGSTAPLREVARRAGYASEFAFGKAFKREYGLSPGGYRRHRTPTASHDATVD